MRKTVLITFCFISSVLASLQSGCNKESQAASLSHDQGQVDQVLVQKPSL